MPMFDRAPFFLLCGTVLAFGASAFGTSCKRSEETDSAQYFDRTIAPILLHSCSRQTTGCHIADDRGNAVGNLDTSAFEMIDRRHDLLVTYGPYSSPGLLTKVSGPQTVSVSTLDGPISITTDIRHAAGSGIDVTSEGYATLKRWMENGATRANIGSVPVKITPSGDCLKTVPTDPRYDPAAPPIASFNTFKTSVKPILRASCSAATCHGTAVADLALTCGDDEAQDKWNAWISSQFVSATAESSEIVRRPLDPSRGGVFHEGGVVFGGSDDDGYKKILAWAKEQGAPAVDKADEGFAFFVNRVQPVMVRRGCMFLGCHSPSMFHDLRRRGGSGGQFSNVANHRNYEMSKLMLSIESPDPNVSRLINKNLYPFDRDIDAGGLGARHRGGALFEDVPGVDRATADACKGIDAEKGDLNTIPGYCVLVAWHKKERELAIKKGAAAGGIDAEPLKGIVYVSRPPFTDKPQDFDTFRGGASLHISAATLDATGSVVMGTDNDVTSGCGLGASPDVRGPAVSWDGTQIAFAGRPSADQPFSIYTMKSDGTGCAKHAAISTHDPKKNDIFIHDFDPAWAPDGRLVFASTRGAIGQSDVDYDGPTRTPGGFLPNANLYALDKEGTIRQLTFLLGQEIAPSFMRDGRAIFTAEKRAPGFYQLAARRINLDGGDYHPLFAQRAVSVAFDLKTKIGALNYEQMTEVAELADRNFIGVFSDRFAIGGAGTIGVVNRSLGPDQTDRDPADKFYLHSLTFPDPGATGLKGTAGGVYRSPAPLPAPSFLASYAAGADASAFDGSFELVQVQTHTGARKTLIAKAAGRSIVEASAIYARPFLGVFSSRGDEVNSSTRVEPGKKDAELTFMDMPLLSSLLFANTRSGRTMAVQAHALGILESLPPPTGVLSIDSADPAFVASDDYGKVWVKRRRLGVVKTNDDGSVGIKIPGGIPIVLELWKDPSDSSPIATQREEMGFYPGERNRQGFRNAQFDGMCGGCHGSISGKEVDAHVRPDVLTSASRVSAVGKPLADLFKDPGSRGTPFGPK